MVNEVASTIVGLAAVATALGLLARLRPVRWVGRTLIGQPVIRAFRREVGEVVAPIEAKVDALTHKVDAIDAELHPNHGSSLRDAVDLVVDQTAT
jgi:hypothetical protein